jgi:hypothetical protein
MLQDDGKEVIFEFLGYGRKTFLLGGSGREDKM